MLCSGNRHKWRCGSSESLSGLPKVTQQEELGQLQTKSARTQSRHIPGPRCPLNRASAQCPISPSVRPTAHAGLAHRRPSGPTLGCSEHAVPPPGLEGEGLAPGCGETLRRLLEAQWALDTSRDPRGMEVTPCLKRATRQKKCPALPRSRAFLDLGWVEEAGEVLEWAGHDRDPRLWVTQGTPASPAPGTEGSEQSLPPPNRDP